MHPSFKESRMDLTCTGSAIAAIFCIVTMLVSIVATKLNPIWYGIGVVAGSFAGYTYAYYRLKWMEKHIDEHVFCKGSILEEGEGTKPSSLVYDRIK